jgi:signal transduction histidine kinase
LRADPLEELGLALAVRTLAEDFAARYALSLTLDIPDQLDNLNLEVEQCYYRVAQETFENIGQHANADQVRVKLDDSNHTLALVIQDDGQGFDPNKETAMEQYGLLGMRERAEIIGAKFHVESRPGAGATIRLTWENGR